MNPIKSFIAGFMAYLFGAILVICSMTIIGFSMWAIAVREITLGLVVFLMLVACVNSLCWIICNWAFEKHYEYGEFDKA